MFRGLLAFLALNVLTIAPASADPLPPTRYQQAVFPVCETLPVDVSIAPQLGDGKGFSLFLGDLVAFAVGSVVTIIENAQAEAVVKGLRWPADEQSFANELADHVVATLDPAVWGTTVRSGEPVEACPWRLVIRAEAAMTTDIEAIGVAVRSELRSRDGSRPPAWVGVLLMTVAHEDIYYRVSNTRRLHAWKALTEDEVRALMVEAFSDIGRLVSYDIKERGSERRGRRLRYIVPGGEYARTREVGARDGQRLLRTQAGLLIAQPDWTRAR